MTPHDSPRLPLILTVLLVTLSSGCGKGPKEPAAAPPAADPVASPTTADAAAPEAIPVVTKFGVAECDTYVDKYLSCIEGKVTAEEREKLMAGFEANRTKWRAMSTMKESAVALGIACRAATQKAKEELSVEYGCPF